jgi:hypothetical protein
MSFSVHDADLGRVTRLLTLVASLAVALGAGSWGVGRAAGAERWYKGQTHCHSFWSDGDDFPEMVADWYKSHGYHFLCPSEHNRIAEGECWYKLNHEKRPATPQILEACRKRFGDGWLELRGDGDAREVRLKTLDEIRATLDEPERFLMIRAEEITGECRDKKVHVNAINLHRVIEPQSGKTVLATIQADLAAVRRQSEATGRTILAHVNHPSWEDYDITAKDLAGATGVRFFELCNNCCDHHNLGDRTHPGTEMIWDIANTIRLAGLKAPVVYGIGSDDAHNYHSRDPRDANPGRGWIMVRAEKLEAETLLRAMERGDFYVSNGVTLTRLDYDAPRKTLSLAVDPKPGAHYTIEFIGSMKSADPTGRDTSKIGRVLATHRGVKANYRLRGDELYVRAVVRSDRKMEDPPAESFDHETAWTQPVGWE